MDKERLSKEEAGMAQYEILRRDLKERILKTHILNDFMEYYFVRNNKRFTLGDMIDIIRFSRYDIRAKMEILEEMLPLDHEEEIMDASKMELSPQIRDIQYLILYHKELDLALSYMDERSDRKYVLKDMAVDDDTEEFTIYEAYPFKTAQQALNAVRPLIEDEFDEDEEIDWTDPDLNLNWFDLDVWETDGDLPERMVTFQIDVSGSIFGYDFSKKLMKEIDKFDTELILEMGKCSFFLPYSVGDIIEVDLSPFYEKQYCIVLETGADTVCPWCATETPNYIQTGALRSGTVFNLDGMLSCIMPYAPELVARKIDPEDLPKRKRVLKEMCSWIDGSEERGKMLSNYIFKEDKIGDGLRKKVVRQYLKDNDNTGIRCIEAGVPAVVLKTWLGHTDIHITLDTYADVFNRMNDDAMKKFEDYSSCFLAV